MNRLIKYGRYALFAEYLGTMVVCAILVCVCRLPADLYHAVVKELGQLYATPLALMLGCMFAVRKTDGEFDSEKIALALILGAIWNGAVIWPMLDKVLGGPTDPLDHWSTIMPLVQILSNSALAVSFIKSGETFGVSAGE